MFSPEEAGGVPARKGAEEGFMQVGTIPGRTSGVTGVRPDEFSDGYASRFLRDW